MAAALQTALALALLHLCSTAASVPAATGACSSLPTCALATLVPGCGWCWQSSQTRQQQHGARTGNAHGPTDGQPCSDWTYEEPECQQHVDCPALPNCLNILGTYCGWCQDAGNQGGRRGTSTGPDAGSCSAWVWNHSDCPPIVGPQQIHLSYSEDPTTMMVTFASQQPGLGSVTWTEAFPGSTPSSSATASGPPEVFAGPYNPDGAHYIYRLAMSVKPGIYYNYSVSTSGITSSSFTFQAMPRPPGVAEPWVAKFLVFGDMGRHGGGMVLDQLTQEVHNVTENVTALIHFGDFAYDLDDDGGINGDTFMARIEALAATHAYMTCVGNHEIEDGNFSNYLRRFTMPRYAVNGGRDMMWHSWNIHQVHFISYSSEVFFTSPADEARMLAWLKEDLLAANAPANRSQYPWIIAYGHRPMMCSNIDGDDCTKNSSIVRAGLEDLFHKYGVDLVFEAHEHSYERLWPAYNNTLVQTNYTNPAAMVHIISGAAGCNEDSGACLNPIVTARLPWSAFHTSAQGTYSFGRLNVHNASHLYFESYIVEEERVEDSFWLVQQHHGMRS